MIWVSCEVSHIVACHALSMLWCSHVFKHATFFPLHFLWHAIFQNISRCCLLQADYALHIACNFSGDSQTVACIRHAISLWRYGWSSQYCPMVSSACIQYRTQFYFFCQQHHKALIRLASNTACNFFTSNISRPLFGFHMILHVIFIFWLATWHGTDSGC